MLGKINIKIERRNLVMAGKTIHELNLGDKASFAKTITEADVILFAGITGDLNPVHIDSEFAKTSIFKSRVAHGGLVAALFSTVLGTQLPGQGTIYMHQDSKFVRPVYIGDTITATVEVIELEKEKNRVKLSTTASNQKGEAVITGYALVMPKR